MDIAGKLPPSQLKSAIARSKARFAQWSNLQGPGLPRPVAGLTFGELEPFASAFLAVLLALVLARIAGEEAELLQPGPQFGIELHQSPRDAQTGGARLAGDTAAVGEDQEVELFHGFGGRERLPDHGPRALGMEIVLERAVVD